MSSQVKTEYEIPSVLPVHIEALIEVEVEKAIAKFEGSNAPIKISIPYPLEWKDIKTCSKSFTGQNDNPILVLPCLTEKDLPADIQAGILQNNIKAGKYCEFKAQIVLISTDSDNKTDYEVCRCLQKYDKDGHHEGFRLKFPDDGEVRGGTYRSELSFNIHKYAYKAVAELETGKRIVTIFADKALDLGAEYIIRGLCWSAADKRNSSAMQSQDLHILADYYHPARDIMEFKEDFFNQFKGLSHSQFVNSCAFPFENSVSDYKELIFLSIFAIKSATIPMNILMVGLPGCTKSGFLQRIASISEDRLLDSGSSTLKGLLPSFSLKNPSAGEMAHAKHFVILNEFFEIIKQAGKSENSYDILSKMKNMLEGVKVPAVSGNGRMDVIMRGSVFMATNWISIGKDVRLTTVNELYAKMDAALLDRFLIYPVPQKEQINLVNQHTIPVKEKIREYTVKNGTTDVISIIGKMDTPYPLNTVTLRTILSYREQLTPVMNKTAQQEIINCGKKIQEEYSYEKYTRALDFISMIASAYSFERALSENNLDEGSRIIEIKVEDIKNAYSYYSIILARHSGKEISESLKKQDFLDSGATSMQKYVLKVLEEAFEDVTKRKMLIEEVEYSFHQKYPEASWESAILPLVKYNLVVWNETHLQWLDYRLENEVVNALSLGGPALALYDSELSRNHLIEMNAMERKYETDWFVGLQYTITAHGSQKPVIETISDSPKMLSEIELQVENAKKTVDYLHLTQKIVRANDGKYSVKGETNE